MNRDVLTSILKTRTVARAIVERFRLQECHQSRYVADAIRSFSAIDDEGRFNADADPMQFVNAEYACGLFAFTK